MSIVPRLVPTPGPAAPAPSGPDAFDDAWRAVLERVRAADRALGAVLERAAAACCAGQIVLGFKGDSPRLALVQRTPSLDAIEGAITAVFGATPPTLVIVATRGRVPRMDKRPPWRRGGPPR